MHWTQVYDPLGHWWLSTLVAALPIIVLFGLLAGLRVKPHWCAIAGALTAVLVAIIVFKMPLALAAMSFGYGVAFGILKIAWIVLAAVYLYDISVETGQFEIMKESVAGITADRRLQVLLVAFCFGAFIEGAAGFGAPVAIAGAFMIGLGFKPFHAAALNLIANTAPVAWGAIGTPVHTLAAVTALPESDLNAMIGRILPFTAIIVPFWLVRAMVNWKETFEVAPAILVVGFSFALTQFFWSNHVDSNLVDIAGGVVSMIATVVFLRFWKPSSPFFPSLCSSGGCLRSSWPSIRQPLPLSGSCFPTARFGPARRDGTCPIYTMPFIGLHRSWPNRLPNRPDTTSIGSRRLEPVASWPRLLRDCCLA